jgi:hypothetical protein
MPVGRTFLPALLLLMPVLPSAADEPVLIEQESHHRLKFENSHVRYFDVQIEPGYEALYHWHHNDGVFVNISAAPTTAQDWGAEPVARGERAIGETYFIGYSAKPKAHRVLNSGSTLYRVSDTEVLVGCGPADVPATGANQTLVIDNDRVFVTRIILHPGESTELLAPCGMLVSVSGGSIALDGPGGVQNLPMLPAGFQWREQRQPVKLTNTGTSVFHGVDIRLK